MREGHGRTTGMRVHSPSQMQSVFLCGHVESLAHGHVTPHGAPVGPNAVSRAGMEEADTWLTHVSIGAHTHTHRGMRHAACGCNPEDDSCQTRTLISTGWLFIPCGFIKPRASALNLLGVFGLKRAHCVAGDCLYRPLQKQGCLAGLAFF